MIDSILNPPSAHRSYGEFVEAAEREKAEGYDGTYYSRSVNATAKTITDKIKQIEKFGYAW
jgi:hypothetical protein